MMLKRRPACNPIDFQPLPNISALPSFSGRRPGRQLEF
jgi:hypothetical protein